MAIHDHIIEAFQTLGGDRTIDEIDNWIKRNHGANWTRSSISTTMADMVPTRLGGNRTSTVPNNKRVLQRVTRGTYRLITNKTKKTFNPLRKLKTIFARSPQPTKELDIKITGTPTPFANPGEKEWKNQLNKQIPPSTGGDEKGVTININYNGRGDLDNLLEPILSVLVNKKNWFHGKRPNIQWITATKQTGTPGCTIKTSTNPNPPPHTGTPIYTTTYQGTLPNKTNQQLLKHIQQTYQQKPANTPITVELTYTGTKINLGDIATGPVKSTIDNLQPILGGPTNNPDDHKITKLQIHKTTGSKTLHIRVTK